MINIRVMTIEDYDQVYNIWINTTGMGMNAVDDSREGIERYLKRNPTTCFVAEDGEKVVGVIMAGHDGRRGFIHHTAVLADYQRQGIASRMVESYMKALDQEGIIKASLVAYGRNEKGNAFWEKQGFGARSDLEYRDKWIHEQVIIET